MFSLINRLPEVFKSSNNEEKNKILKYLISNSLQTGNKADIYLKKPFVFLYKKKSCLLGRPSRTHFELLIGPVLN